MAACRKVSRYSFLVNLFVLTLVFAIIFTLQHSKRTHTTVAPPVPAAAQPAVPRAEETKSENITFTELQRPQKNEESFVEILDNETARQNYLATNKVVLTKNTITSKKNLGNFIPFEK